MKNLNYDLRSLGRDGLIGEESGFIQDFLDKKIKQQTKITGELKSTLKSLERRISIPRSQILVEYDKEVD